LLFLWMASALSAQDNVPLRIAVEAGGADWSGEPDTRWNIRQDVNSYGANLYADPVHAGSEGSFQYIGIKPEFTLWKGRVYVGTGLRFSTAYEFLGNISEGEQSYFFLRRQGHEAVEFYRIRSIEETVNHLSVPLEISLVVLGYRSNWQLYVKAGSEIGMKVYGKTHIRFRNPEMNPYAQELLDDADIRLNRFYSTLYGTIGLRLTQRNGIRYSAEVIIPSRYLTKDNFSVVTPQEFSGAQFSISFPMQLFIGKSSF